MYSSHATSQVLIAVAPDNEACVLDQPTEFLLRRESLDAFHQVLVGIAVPSNELADQGDGAEAPALVDGVEERGLDFAELETGEYAAGF